MGNRLLLVGWDAADWKILRPLIDAREMPALARMIANGSSGALLCVQPQVAVAQWTSIATGKRPWQHRVCHPIKAFDRANQPHFVTAAEWRSRPLWEILATAGNKSLVVGWPATHGAQPAGTILVSERYANPTAAPGVKPWPPGVPGTYSPPETGARLDPLRVSPQDIQADVISAYVPEWKKVDQKRDRRIGQLRLFLAADFSHHAAIMTLLSQGQWNFAAVRFPALGAISQIFLAHRPPRAEWLPEGEFALYQNVIRNACRRLDQMLRLMVQRAGPGASVVVVSTHGVSQRPPPPAAHENESWKSSHGIFAASGPHFARNSLVFGATSLDVAPTILTCFGLPIGDDMEGRVLSEALAKPPDVTRVASWEPAISTAASRAANGAGAETAAIPATLQRESDWNLARSFWDGGRYEEALPILERSFRAFPERTELAHSLFRCQLELQKFTDAGETLQVLLEGLPPGIWSILPRAEWCAASKKTGEARSLVAQAANLQPNHPEALRRLGMLMLQLREWSALAALARRALALDENEPLAWLGLAEAQLRGKLAGEAESAALRAIGLNYYLPQAHFVLARALIAQGKWDQARDAMQALLSLQPNNRAAATYAKRFASQPDPLRGTPIREKTSGPGRPH